MSQLYEASEVESRLVLSGRKRVWIKAHIEIHQALDRGGVNDLSDGVGKRESESQQGRGCISNGVVPVSQGLFICNTTL